MWCEVAHPRLIGGMYVGEVCGIFFWAGVVKNRLQRLMQLGVCFCWLRNWLHPGATGLGWLYLVAATACNR